MIALAFTGLALAAEPEIPVVDGHLGSCSRDFTVRDRDHKPIYNAKISVLIRYGALGLHKMSLEVGTDSEGRARVAGLPEKVKKPLGFKIESGQLSKELMVDTTNDCKASIDVDLQ
jgi:hypothetical protein